MRTGRSATWGQAQIEQTGRLGTTLTACFGDNRESHITLDPPQFPQAKSVEDSFKLPFMPGITPDLTQNFDIRWAIGTPPMGGAKEPEIGAWVKFNDATGFGEPHLIALLDVLPPAVSPLFKKLGPLSSLTWQIELLDDLSKADAQDSDGWWFIHAYAHAAAAGYSQQQAVLYTPAGRAIGMSRQVIAIFV